MPNHQDVKKIKDYLAAKISAIKSKIAEYEAPTMQELVTKNSYMQKDYIRQVTQLEIYEDVLLTIDTFTPDITEPKVKAKKKDPSDEKETK
jgi:hypothetical protein